MKRKNSSSGKFIVCNKENTSGLESSLLARSRTAYISVKKWESILLSKIYYWYLLNIKFVIILLGSN